MKDGFRQRMAWLHTWCGLTAGWLLCAIFLTGTLSVFREPITQWMAARPPLPVAVPTAAGPPDGGDALGPAVQHLARLAPASRFWRIELPARPDEAIVLAWRAGRDNRQVAMHPLSGMLLPEPWGRKTEGGRHFMSFHYTLHGGTAGYWLVGWLSMCMLVALVSGVVVHRRIFKDFFTFRPAKGQRSWLDAHNATAVLALPFLFMIVYTGVAFFYTSYMPWPMQAAYGAAEGAYARFQSELADAPPQPSRPRTGVPAALHGLAPLLATAQSLTGRPARMVVIDQPGDRSMVVRVFGRGEEEGAEGGAKEGGGGDDVSTRSILNPPAIVAFDGVTGAVLHVQRPAPPARFSSEQVYGVMASLHLARFGGWPLKWLYFLSGLMGTAMMATGTILFAVKRRAKSERTFGAATAGIYRAVDALNVSALAGICLASIAYLYGNRLLPVAMPGRDLWEVRVFLLVWAATLLHAGFRPAARAWVEQLGLAAALCLALPLLNQATTGRQLTAYLADGDWPRAGVEIVTLGFGIALGMAAWRVHRGWRQPVPALKTPRLPRTGARA